MQHPPNIDGELRGLGTGQEHAKVERMQKPGLIDPVAFLHQFAMHDRDLPCRTSETDETELQPKAECFAKTRPRTFGHERRCYIHFSAAQKCRLARSRGRTAY